MIASRLNARSAYLLGMACAALWWPGSARGQAMPVDSSGGARRDISSGIVLGLLVPGGGQLYAGRTEAGTLLLAIAIDAPLFGNAYEESRQSSYFCAPGGGSCGPPPDHAFLNYGLAASAIVWLYGLSSAPGDVRAWNAKHAPPPVSLYLRDAPRRALIGAAVRISF